MAKSFKFISPMIRFSSRYHFLNILNGEKATHFVAGLIMNESEKVKVF